MGIQNKLSNKQSKLKRKLMDYNVRQSGFEDLIIRLQVDENKYEDEEVEVINHNIITCIIDYPGELPLFRVRENSQVEISGNTGVFLYDILPIEILAQWKDRLEIGDILIRKIFDENGSIFLNILRVSNVLGAFKDNLIWKKYNAAPHNMVLTEEILNIIDGY